MVSKSWQLAGPPVLAIFLFGDVLSGPSIRNFQDHVPGFLEVGVAEQLVEASSEELGWGLWAQTYSGWRLLRNW